MLAANTVVPVIGVPMQSRALNGMDSLLSIVQMPAGVPVATMAIGQSGAKNAALLAAQIVGLQDSKLQQALQDFRLAQRREAQRSEQEL
jgi:5-(carboxyamino)imidazole ribonucleotide mutase